MKKILLGLCISFYFSTAQAEWVVDQTVLKVKSKDPVEIARLLTTFPQILEALTAENLTSPSRVIVKEFQGSIINYRWENDDDCKVADPSKIEKIQTSAALAAFIYSEAPNDLMGIEYGVGVSSPCDGLKKNPKSKRLKNKKTK